MNDTLTAAPAIGIAPVIPQALPPEAPAPADAPRRTAFPELPEGELDMRALREIYLRWIFGNADYVLASPKGSLNQITAAVRQAMALTAEPAPRARQREQAPVAAEEVTWEDSAPTAEELETELARAQQVAAEMASVYRRQQQLQGALEHGLAGFAAAAGAGMLDPPPAAAPEPSARAA